MQRGRPIILFECKQCGADLDRNCTGQLQHCFAATAAKVGVLTDGAEYRFYSDVYATNLMDARPFLVFNMLRPENLDAEALKAVHGGLVRRQAGRDRGPQPSASGA